MTPPTSRLLQKFESGRQVFTAEITPPKGAGIKKLVGHAELLGPHVDAINITDCQRALVRMSSMAACKVILDRGFEPVYQLTCRDRNGIGLQSDLMGAYALGIRNLLCLTGDPVKVGDSPTSKPVFEMESVRLLETAARLQGGRDNEGHKMNAPTKFYVGAVVNPTLQNRSQLLRMEKKIKAGALFFQTQANYDLHGFHAFLSETRQFNVKVLAGILILHSEEMAKYVHDNIPGIQIPAPVLEQFSRAGNDPESVGIDFAVETMLRLDAVCEGFHMMSIREEALIPKVLEKYYEQRKTRQNTASPEPSAARS